MILRINRSTNLVIPAMEGSSLRAEIFTKPAMYLSAGQGDDDDDDRQMVEDEEGNTSTSILSLSILARWTAGQQVERFIQKIQLRMSSKIKFCSMICPTNICVLSYPIIVLRCRIVALYSIHFHFRLSLNHDMLGSLL